MADEFMINICQREQLPLQTRQYEIRIGDEVKTLQRTAADLKEGLDSAHKAGATCVLIGVPEDIGPRANCGRGGAHGAWSPFLKSFLNMQSNRFFNGNNVLVLGNIEVDDLLAQTNSLDNTVPGDLQQLRGLCKQVDERVYPIIHAVVSANMDPVIIGGGHNNAYPIIKATSDALVASQRLAKKGIGCINCDPHLDFREADNSYEGRHSGNPFSHAFDEGSLHAYFCVGAHESYNSEEMLRRIDTLNGQAKRIKYSTFEDILDSGGQIVPATEQALEFLNAFDLPIGLELDLDSIASMPVSAATSSGIHVNQAREYIRTAARQADVRYLHLPEGAPMHDANGDLIVGKTLAYLVSDYIKVKTARGTKA